MNYSVTIGYTPSSFKIHFIYFSNVKRVKPSKLLLEREYIGIQTLLWKLEDNCVNFYASWNLYKYLEEVKTRQHCLVMIFATSFLKDFSWTLFFWIWKFLLPNSITMLTTTFEGLTIPQGPPWIQWKTFRLTWFFDKMHFIGHIFWCIVFLFPLLNHPTFGSDAHIWKILNYFNWSWDIYN